MEILGLLIFACFIWWITTGTGYLNYLATSSREPLSPGAKAIWWMAYAVTALWVLANSSCESSEPLGRREDQQSHYHAQEIPAGQSLADRFTKARGR